MKIAYGAEGSSTEFCVLGREWLGGTSSDGDSGYTEGADLPHFLDLAGSNSDWDVEDRVQVTVLIPAAYRTEESVQSSRFPDRLGGGGDEYH